MLSEGTQVAQLDEQRFQTALESAKSKVRIETLRRDGLQLQLDESLPAEIRSAEAKFNLAQTELNRNQRLVQQGAGSGKKLDAAQAEFDAARSALDGLNAKLAQAKAEVQSAAAGIEQANQAVIDAQRNLNDTRLFSAFPGQVADVQVVPGSLAGPGSQVATVQMMNPIKVDVEVSAELSRRLVVGEEIFWGKDRMDFLEREIRERMD